MTLQRVVIVGGGHGGFQMAASLRGDGFKGEVLLVGDEPGLPYQRPPLSKAFLKHGDSARLDLRPSAFFEKNEILLMPQTRVTGIDPESKHITTYNGKEIAYDHLVLATGSRNARPPIANLDLKNVLTLRNLADAADLRTRLTAARHVLVVGGGFIGMEFAAVAPTLSVNATVIEGAERLMARAVSDTMSLHFLKSHQGWGTRIRLGQFVSGLLDDGSGNVAGARLADGTEIAGDIVLIAAGVVPNSELATDAGLAVSDGIDVDDLLRTSNPDISALGDCCNYPDPLSGRRVRLESVQAATDHARTISKRLTGQPASYTAVPWFWSDQGDLKLQIAGLGAGADEHVAHEPEKGGLVVLSFAAGRLVSVETVDSASTHMTARKLFGSGRIVSKPELAAVNYNLVDYARAV